MTAKGVLLLFNKEDISKMRTMLTEDWIQIPDDGRCADSASCGLDV